MSTVSTLIWALTAVALCGIAAYNDYKVEFGLLSGFKFAPAEPPMPATENGVGPSTEASICLQAAQSLALYRVDAKEGD